MISLFSMISVENITKSYTPEIFAVQDVSFEVPKGTITCLIGPSGCGKTSLLKMLNQLVEPTSGSITINNQSPKDSSPVAWRRRIGYVIQKIGLFPHLTIRQNLCLPPHPNVISETLKWEKAKDLLVKVGLDPLEFADRYPPALSGGQQQRVGIARALITDPPVLLMDEPFGALDPIIRKQMQNELIDLNQQLQKTIVIVTHDIAEAFRLGDQIILMNKGQIVQKGAKKDFIDEPINSFCKEFIDSQLVALS
jgi:osmoprotectant transport system ATP-binding protein